MKIFKSRFFVITIILEAALIAFRVYAFNYINSDPEAFNAIFIISTVAVFIFIIVFFYFIAERDIELLEQKRILDALLEHTTDEIVIKHIDGKLMRSSKSVRNLHDFTGRFSFTNITDKDVEPNSIQIRNFLETVKNMDELIWQTKKPQKFVLQHKDREDRVHTVDVTKIPVFNEKGEGFFSITLGHDITEVMEEEEKFESLFYNNSMVMFLADPETATIIDVNDSAIKFWGFSREELIGKTLNETFNPFISTEEILLNINKASENKQRTFSGYKHRLKNGEIKDVEIDLSLIYIKGKPVELVTVFDITDRLAGEAKIKSLQSLYYSILKEVSLIINPKSERELFHRTLGALQKSEIITACWIGFIEEDKSIKYAAAKGKGAQELMKIKLKAVCDRQYMTLAERAICFNRIFYNNDELADPLLAPWIDFLKKNSWLAVCACPISRDKKVWGALVCVSDKKDVFTQNVLEFMSKIADLLSHSLNEFDLKKKLEQEKINVEYLAHHDALTGLPNRLYLTQLMDSALKRADRNKTYAAVGIIDFDDFKLINDTFGHDEGDNLLKMFADRIKSVLRQTDHMIRLGGDEFILVIEDLKTTEDIYLFISRLEESIKKPFVIKNSEIFLKISLGFTLYPIDKNPSNILLIHADNAMYNIKSKKEDREKFWHMYEPE